MLNNGIQWVPRSVQYRQYILLHTIIHMFQYQQSVFNTSSPVAWQPYDSYSASTFSRVELKITMAVSDASSCNNSNIIMGIQGAHARQPATFGPSRKGPSERFMNHQNSLIFP